MTNEQFLFYDKNKINRINSKFKKNVTRHLNKILKLRHCRFSLNASCSNKKKLKLRFCGHWQI